MLNIKFLIFHLSPKNSNPSTVSLPHFGTNRKFLGGDDFGSLNTQT